jgi:hypothetical protein
MEAKFVPLLLILTSKTHTNSYMVVILMGGGIFEVNRGRRQKNWGRK